MNPLLDMVISGGQTGADYGALKAARRSGVATGGWVPLGCRTLEGPNLDLVRVYGCKEHASPHYPPRTWANVKEADATLRFASDFNSPGERCTLKAIRALRKIHFDVDVNDPPSTAIIKQWLRRNHVRVLNVAGNSERTSPGIERFVMLFMRRLLRTTKARK